MSDQIIIFAFGIVIAIQAGTIAFLTAKLRNKTDEIKRYSFRGDIRAKRN